MRAFVITLEEHEYSEACAARCIQSAAAFGVHVEPFRAVARIEAQDVMKALGLHWTWAKLNNAYGRCQLTGLNQHPYGDLQAKIGCSLSHYLLWQKCVAEGPMLILEHDAVFLRALSEFEFDGICQVNDPAGATHRGEAWSQHMRGRGPGVFPKTRVMEDPHRPDGLAGNSAYVIKPWAAQELIDAFHRFGVWPNDATMCVQLFPYLQELYPWVTRVQQSVSTTS